MAGYVQDPVTGQWYETDSNNEIIYTRTAPENMEGILTREYDTGQTVDDPNTKRTYYSVGDGYARDTDGYRLRAYGRGQRRDNIRAILSGNLTKGVKNINEVTDAEKALYNVYGTHKQFGRFFKDDGNLRRRALRNKSFLNELKSNRYSSDENYRENDDIQTISMGTDKDARLFAQRLDNIIYPTLTKVVPGHFESSRMRRNNSQTKAQIVTRNPHEQSRPQKKCKNCEKQKELANAGRSQSTSTSTPTRNRPVKRSKLKWIGRETRDIGATYNTSYEYDQMPLMSKEYAVPVQLTPHTETEIKPGTSTPKTTDTPRPRLKTKVRSTTSQTPVKKPTSTPPSKTSTPDQVRTVTWQTFPDGSLVEDKQYTDWRNVE